MSQIRVMLVDDHPAIRDGIKAALGSANVEVVGEAADGGEAVEIARKLQPDVILMDLNLITVSGVEAIRQIFSELPQTKILVLSSEDDEPMVKEAIVAGAMGYLLKTTPAPEIVDAVRRTYKGETVFTPSLATIVLGEFRRLATSRPQQPEAKLSDLEKEFIALQQKGASVQEISKHLNVSLSGVHKIGHEVMAKLRSGAPDA